MVLDGMSCAMMGEVVGGEMVACWNVNEGSQGWIQLLHIKKLLVPSICNGKGNPQVLQKAEYDIYERLSVQGLLNRKSLQDLCYTRSSTAIWLQVVIPKCIPKPAVWRCRSRLSPQKCPQKGFGCAPGHSMGMLLVEHQDLAGCGDAGRQH